MTTVSADSICDNSLWLLSFYRVSEIQGALFFGRLANRLEPGPIQMDMTRHFADESQHARYWTDCIQSLGRTPLRLKGAYQDKYSKTVGIPTSMMQILAITHVFEERAIRQYGVHLQAPDLHPAIEATLQKIMGDEQWHLDWVSQALKTLEQQDSTLKVAETLKHYRQADHAVFGETLHEYGDRIVSATGQRIPTSLADH
jgi:hypothetical protein